MKLTIEKKSLVRALAHVVPVADPKSTMPVLANVKISTDAGRLFVATSRLSISAFADETATIGDAGAICLHARDLFDRVRAMPDADITIETKGNAATIKAKGSPRKFTIHGVPGEEFPRLPEQSSSEWKHEISAVELLELLTVVSPAISPDESRPHLSSMLLECQDGSVRAVATDGHRLHLMANGGLPPEQLPSGVLVSQAAVARLRGLVDGATGNVLLAKSGRSLWVTVNGLALCCTLTEGTFPPYRQVIPPEFAATSQVGRKALIDSIKAVSVAAGDNSGVLVSFAKDKMILKAESADGGEGVDSIDCVREGAVAESYGFSARYLLDALTAIQTDQVELKLSGSLDPVVILPVGTKHEMVTLLMPMRI